jgi:hypothetical protein
MLLVGNSDEELVERLWVSMRDGATFDSLAEVLADYGLRRLPSLGLAVGSDEGIRLLVRGAVTARVGAEPAAVVIGAEAAVTWQERSISGAVEVVLTTADNAAGAWPLIGGVVAASAARLSWGTASAENPVRWAPAVVRVEAPLAEQPYEGLAEGSDLQAGDEPTDPEPEPESAPDEEPEQDAVEAPMHTMVAPEPDDDYDHMFGATRHVSVEAAAVRPADLEDEETPAAAPPVAMPIPVTEPPPPVRPTSEREQPVMGSGLIDAVPGGFTATHPGAAPVASGAAPAGDHDGMTMSRDQILQLKGASPTPVSPADPHQVLAVSCPHGHMPSAVGLVRRRSLSRRPWPYSVLPLAG